MTEEEFLQKLFAVRAGAVVEDPRADGLDAQAALVGKHGATLEETAFVLYGFVLEDKAAYLTLLCPKTRAQSALADALETHLKALFAPMGLALHISFTALRGAEKSTPLAQGMMPNAGKRPAPKPAAMPGVRHVIAVASGKGGVGKSTMACALALGLARMGLAVGLLDADIHGPSQPRIFGLAQEPELDEENRMLPPLKHGVKLMSIGLMLKGDAPAIWRGPMVGAAVRQMLERVSWGALDALLVDMPPGTGDAPLSLVQTVQLRGAVIVSTPQDLALQDALRAMAMFEKVGVPILGLIENMSQFLCPHCGEPSSVFGHGGVRREALVRGLPFLGEAPLTLAIRKGMDEGAPVQVSAPHSADANMLFSLAEGLWREVERTKSPSFCA